MTFLEEAAVFLAAAVIAVILAARLRLGGVLGFLLAGVAIGPYGAGFVEEPQSVLAFSELGIVLLLFIIGLELAPQRLWTMRRQLLGLGSAQVVLAAAPVTLVAMLAAGLTLTQGIVIGLALALSSTAFALQTMAERKDLSSRQGRGAFSILLFQDVVAIPLLALIPLLADPRALGEGIDPWLVVRALGVVALTLVGGRYLMRFLLPLIAATGVREAFAAAALLAVVGAALVMESLGLSAGLGAFLAGVVLADSDYRRALEADIEPFKGILLGLFFMAVGMTVDLRFVAEEPLLLAGLTLGLVALKAGGLFLVGKLAGMELRPAALLAVYISQGGEFAFVIFAAAGGAGLLPPEVTGPLVAAVGLSLATTPVLLLLADKFLPKPRIDRPYDKPEELDDPVVIAGFGRVGQIAGRILRAKGIGFTAVDIDPSQVDVVRAYGNKVHYGDASRADILRAAKTGEARLFILAIDDVEASVETARTVRELFPRVPVLARVRNRRHAHRLMELGVTQTFRETFASSLELAEEMLRGLGYRSEDAKRMTLRFRAHDERRLIRQFDHWSDDEKLQAMAREDSEELRQIFKDDASEPMLE